MPSWLSFPRCVQRLLWRDKRPFGTENTHIYTCLQTPLLELGHHGSCFNPVLINDGLVQTSLLETATHYETEEGDVQQSVEARNYLNLQLFNSTATPCCPFYNSRTVLQACFVPRPSELLNKPRPGTCGAFRMFLRSNSRSFSLDCDTSLLIVSPSRVGKRPACQLSLAFISLHCPSHRPISTSIVSTEVVPQCR